MASKEECFRSCNRSGEIYRFGALGREQREDSPEDCKLNNICMLWLPIIETRAARGGLASLEIQCTVYSV